MNERTTPTDDEALSAYLDGELPEPQADRLTKRLAAEPALLARLEALCAADDGARRAFAAVDAQPLPQRVLDRIDSERAPRAPAGRDDKRAGNVIPWPARVLRPFLQLPVGLAAAVALAAGLFVSLERLPGHRADDLQRAVAADSGLYRVLDSGLSTAPVALPGGAEGAVLLTFEDRAGRYCRQVRMALPGNAYQALACRAANGWQLQAVAYGAPADPANPYQQASGGAPPAIDAAIDALIGEQAPLDADTEAALIGNGWKKNRP